ncbi:MAG TPA: nuclease-related domain-containing protein [Gaiellaceae bacterium]
MRRREARRRRKEAGASARKKFRELRREKIRASWRDWVVIVVAIALLVAAIVILSGVPALVFAALVGAFVTLAGIVWMIGGDVHSLTWIWGAVGEEATAEALGALDDSWTFEHDLQHDHGNWDHVVVGPAGIFLLETKNLSAKAVVRHDALAAGSMLFRGGGLRRAAARLSERFGSHLDRSPWVQPVFVVWGTFPHGSSEANGVVYVRGDELIPWLAEQPQRLTASQFESAVAALRDLRADRRDHECALR